MKLDDVLRCRYPLIQAGMGGVAGTRLAVAVSQAGGSGVLGLYRLPADLIYSRVRSLQRSTSGLVGVNLIPEVAPNYGEQALAVLEAAERPLNFLFFGHPNALTVSAIRQTGDHKIGVQIGCLDDIVKPLTRAYDYVVLQAGVRAGGHLLGQHDYSELIKIFYDHQPDYRGAVASSGGVSSAKEYRKRLHAGYTGVLAGTAFVVAEESDAHQLYKYRLIAEGASSLRVTNEFEIGWPGRSHRVMQPPFPLSATFVKRAIIAWSQVGKGSYPIPRYSSVVPTKYSFGRVTEMVMYAGLDVDACTEVRTAADILRSIVEEECQCPLR